MKRLLAVCVAAVGLLCAVVVPASAAGYVSPSWVTASKGTEYQVAAYLNGSGTPVSWPVTGDGEFVKTALLPSEMPGAQVGAAVPPNVIDSSTWGMAMSEVWPLSLSFAANGVVTLSLRQAGGSNWSGIPGNVECIDAAGVISAGSWVTPIVVGGNSQATYSIPGQAKCVGSTVYSVDFPEYSLNWAMRAHHAKFFNPSAGGSTVGAQAWIPEAVGSGPIRVLQYRRGACGAPADPSCSPSSMGGGNVVQISTLRAVCTDGASGDVTLLLGVIGATTVCVAHGAIDYFERVAVADATGSWQGFRLYMGVVKLRTTIECQPNGTAPAAGPGSPGRRVVTGTGSPAPFVVCNSGEWAYSVTVAEPVSGTVLVQGFFREWQQTNAVPTPTPTPSPIVAPPPPTQPPSQQCADLKCTSDSIVDAIYKTSSGVTEAIYKTILCNDECRDFRALQNPMQAWSVKVQPWLDQISWVGGSFGKFTPGQCDCGGYEFDLNMPAIGNKPGISHHYEILNTCSGWASTLAATSRAGTSLLLVLGTGAACVRLIAAAFSFVGLVDDFRGKE